MAAFGNVDISWTGHDGFIISGSQVICIDPFKTTKNASADFILITHEHFDHLSIEDITKFIGKNTTIVCPRSCEPALNQFQRIIIMKPGDEIPTPSGRIKAIAAYNTNKFREGQSVFHPKEEGKLGYLITIDGTTIYHAGDTDMIPEMNDLAPDVALLPVSGTYVMTAEEAAQAAQKIRPKFAIPMHYGAIVGSSADAESFRQMLSDSGITVSLMDVSK